MATHAYVTRCECGSLNSAIVDDPSDKSYTAEEIARWIASNLTP